MVKQIRGDHHNFFKTEYLCVYDFIWFMLSVLILLITFVLQVQLFLIQVRQLKLKLGKIILSSVQDQGIENQVPKNSSSTLPFPD